MRSLRARLIGGILAAVTVLLGAGGGAAYWVIQERLYLEFDRNLIQRTALLAAMIETDDGVLRIEWLELGDLPADGLPRVGGTLANPVVRAVTLPGGRPGRCAGIGFDVSQGLRRDEESPGDPAGAMGNGETVVPGVRMVQLVVAEVDTVRPTLAALRWPFLGLWAGCALLGGVLAWMIVCRGLRPLEELRARIEDLRGTGGRIGLARAPAELEPVIRELNRLLERVDDALHRERTLTSNIAHELRTPISGLLSTIEVTLSRVRSGAEYQESARECFEIAKRMNWLVVNLLALARLESGGVKLQPESIHVADALTEWWKPFEPHAAERGLRVDWKLEGDAQLRTDPEFLRVVVTNLFDNAVSYAPEGGMIFIEAGADRSIAVANQAVAVSAETVRRAFDLFWRSAAADESDTGHAGLGLNLCRRIVALLGGRISADYKESRQMFVVSVEMAG